MGVPFYLALLIYVSVFLPEANNSVLITIAF